MKFVRALLMMGAVAMPALANLPTFDNTGNSLLNGTYYFREVIYVVGDNAGDLSQDLAEYGTITFNGTGGYTIPNGTVNSCSSSGCGQSPLATSGTYTFAASGYGYFTNPLSSSSGTYTNYGLISNGVLIASATENGFNSLFIAVPVTSPVASNSSFQGNYQMAGFFPGSASSSEGATYQVNPDGAGNLGTVSISGYFAGTGAQVYSQSSAVKYAFSNGAGVLTFPTSSTANFYSGQVFLYISADHNFVFGGSPNGFDMFVGVKKSTGSVSFSGIYYEAGLDFDATQFASAGFSNLDTYYGTFNAGNGNVTGHERLLYGISGASQGFTYTATYPTSVSTGAYSVTSGSYQTQYTFGNNGAVRIGFGVGPSLGLSVALQAPTLSGSGVYLNPQGVVNAASYAPFTAGVSPGEIVVLYGSGLAPSFQAASSLPLPGTLNGVQVTVNGVTAPIYYVSPTQLSVVIPYSAAYTSTTGPAIARILVTNASGQSNAVTEFFNLTTPGVFSQTANGLGLGSVYHVTSAGFTAVTNSAPAQPGETVVAYISGLGSTVPSVMEGTAGPTSPLANTVNNFDVYVGGTEACGSETNATPCPFVGLAPYLANVYQYNIPIPSTATSGLNALEILGPDSDDYQVSIPVGNGAGAASARLGSEPQDVRARMGRQARPASQKARAVPCFITDQTCSARGI
jgi:uncharacterized protein (TIGR03437 family)